MSRLLHYAGVNDVEDPTNNLQKRTIKNSHKFNYNCGGYALNTFNWYLPRSSDFFWSYSSNLDEVTDYMVNCMLQDFNGRLRVIENENETKNNETCIAFRVGGSDFHYAKKSKNGQWRHKMGDSSHIDYMTKKELYSIEGWYYGKYNGKIVLMALKNS